VTVISNITEMQYFIITMIYNVVFALLVMLLKRWSISCQWSGQAGCVCNTQVRKGIRGWCCVTSVHCVVTWCFWVQPPTSADYLNIWRDICLLITWHDNIGIWTYPQSQFATQVVVKCTDIAYVTLYIVKSLASHH
jgi:hypothetical protein